MSNPFSEYVKVLGRHNTLAGFVPTLGKQESVTGGSETHDVTQISTALFHSKLVTLDDIVRFILDKGVQCGQLKKLTLTHKGTENAIAHVQCPALTGGHSTIVFSEVGDQVLLLWDGKYWCILESLNLLDPASSTPEVEQMT